MNVRVFADPPVVAALTTLGLTIRNFRTPAEVSQALAQLRWDVGVTAVVDLHLRGLLGAEIVDYIASRHPTCGLWGIDGLVAGDVAEIVRGGSWC